jgi:VanZ family protein
MSMIPSSAASRWLAFAYAIVVVGLSSYPGLRLPETGTDMADKVVHFIQYAILAFLVSRGWGPMRPGGATGLRAWLPVIVLLVFASADEYHQHWIPGRYPEWIDWFADVLGIAVGFALGMRANRTTVRQLGAK